MFEEELIETIDWHFRFQRPQHLSRQLAATGHRVFYLVTKFTSEWDEPGFRIVESPEKNVFIVQLSCSEPHPESIYRDFATISQQQHLVASLAQLLRTCGIKQLVSIVDLPFWRNIAEALPGNLMIYDCMDHHAGFSTNTKTMLKEEHLLLHSADLVLTTSQRLSDNVGKEVPNVVIRNGAEVAFFAQKPAELEYAGSRPVVGYFGAISEWFDMDLVIPDKSLTLADGAVDREVAG